MLIPWFSKSFSIRMEEAERPVDTYRTLNEFFIRRLKESDRPIDPHPSALVSPVDAAITGIGRIDDHLKIQVKGQHYKTEESLDHSPTFERYRGGFYIVLYLSPAEYHRVHSPVTGTIIGKVHIRGTTYPVNEFGLTKIRKVLSRNERLITYIQHPNGIIPVIKVGAMNVSGIKYANPLAGRLNKGDELAYFEFGSTVVLLLENGPFKFCSNLCVGHRVRVGEPLGYWRRTE
ncbi:archaetidylserine decarboxylase [Paenibacillus sp. P25]|nr:archaetidylserine decarboxylase [Paenibacillus sp. P25]